MPEKLRDDADSGTMTRDAYLDLLARQDDSGTGGSARKGVHAESVLQRSCVAWFRAQYPGHALMLFAVPNGGARSAAEAGIMKAEGVTAGVSDLILLESRGGWGALCLEAKTTRRGSGQSERQRIWQAAAEDAGNRYEVFRTFEEFVAVVRDYMSLPAGAGRVRVTGAEIAAAMIRVPDTQFAKNK